MFTPLQIMEHWQIRSYVAKLDMQYMEMSMANVKWNGKNIHSNYDNDIKYVHLQLGK